MGINPGESEEDWSEGEKKQREAGKWTPLAQTRNGERSTTDSGKKWAETIEYYTCSRLVVTSELFFWSARSQPEIENQFGQPWYKPPHFRFSLNSNKLLIAQYGPRAALVIGITAAERVRVGLGLKLINTKCYDQKGLRIVEHHFDGQRPWFFVRHPAEREIEKVEEISEKRKSLRRPKSIYIHSYQKEPNETCWHEASTISMSGNARRDAIGDLFRSTRAYFPTVEKIVACQLTQSGVESMIWVQDDDPSMRRIAFDPGYKRCALWTRFEA